MEIPRAYSKTMSSLQGLELTCEKDEGDLTAKLISLQLAKNDDDEDITAGAYDDDVGGMKLGHLIFEEFTTENDALSREAIHKTKKEPLVCKGRAFVNSQPINVIVFREKPAV
jgi:hypothetical protein